MKEEAKDVGKPVVDSWVDFKHFGLGLGVEVSEDYLVSTKKRKVNEGTLARAKFSPWALSFGIASPRWQYSKENH